MRAGLFCEGMEEEEACQQAEAKSRLSPVHNHLFPCRAGLHDAMK